MQLPNLYEYATSAPENASFGFRTLSRDGVPCLVWQLPPGTDPREEGGEQGAGERVVRGAGDVEAVGLSRPSSHGVGVGRDGENAPVSEGEWRGEGRGRGEGRVVGRGGGRGGCTGWSWICSSVTRNATRRIGHVTSVPRSPGATYSHTVYIYLLCASSHVSVCACASLSRGVRF